MASVLVPTFHIGPKLFEYFLYNLVKIPPNSRVVRGGGDGGLRKGRRRGMLTMGHGPTQSATCVKEVELELIEHERFERI